MQRRWKSKEVGRNDKMLAHDRWIVIMHRPPAYLDEPMNLSDTCVNHVHHVHEVCASLSPAVHVRHAHY